MERSGMWGSARGYQEVLKGRPDIYSVNHRLHLLSSFQDFPGGIIFNPTFRYTSCGAEILNSERI
ncbi:hypothetical protein Barb7_00694 [Bacteroidales bacterium Barb7]|nr:hypothetical protein Barb7_00694 [Bacteroidales bacterium Barb7]